MLLIDYLSPCNRGAALLVEAADMGDKDAQYELGCRMRVEVSFLHLIFFLFFFIASYSILFHLGPFGLPF